MHYTSWGAFAKARADAKIGAKVSAKFKECIQRAAQPGATPTFKPKEANSSTEISVEVSKLFRGYTTASIIKKLDCTRLNAQAKQSAPTCTGPNVQEPGDVTYHLFCHEGEYSHEDDGFDVVVRAAKKYKVDDALVGKAGNLHADHAQEEFQHAAGKDAMIASVRSAIGSKKMGTLGDFVGGYEGHVRKVKKQQGDTSIVGLAGRMMEELEIVEEPEDDLKECDNLHTDLTDEMVKSTPRKHKSNQNPEAALADELGDGAASAAVDQEEPELDEALPDDVGL